MLFGTSAGYGSESVITHRCNDSMSCRINAPRLVKYTTCRSSGRNASSPEPASVSSCLSFPSERES